MSLLHSIKSFGLVCLSLVCLLPSCNSEKPAEKKMISTPMEAAQEIIKEDSALDIMAGSNCKNCHNKSQKSVGPSYYEIARKYGGDSSTIATLVSKIKNGGSGVWGNVPMAAHPELREEDIKTIVDYIVNLDK